MISAAEKRKGDIRKKLLSRNCIMKSKGPQASWFVDTQVCIMSIQYFFKQSVSQLNDELPGIISTIDSE